MLICLHCGKPIQFETRKTTANSITGKYIHVEQTEDDHAIKPWLQEEPE